MQAEQKKNSTDLSLEGLEGILNSTEPSDKSSEDNTISGAGLSKQDWTIEETARALGLTRGAVIRRLEDGLIPGYKVRRSYGWVWRVKPVWLEGESESEEQNVQSESRTGEKQVEDSCCNDKSESLSAGSQGEFVEVMDAGDEYHSLPSTSQSSFREMIELKTKLQMAEFQFQDSISKLEAANYRIGYLEARLEASQEQLKLLTQREPSEPWWRKWFRPR